ncbi:MAG: bifunctional folylpolyglutamate synthase/dihydrofolate synthase [Candidatus Omnitrophica bacterium]|nr:bifunctional folylpolyglutamate synthase/dihydrofolate synthase [Candidatus Omnitrophota bacterium]
MNSSEVHTYLNSFTNFESQLHKLLPEDFNLNRIQKFLDLAGNPAKNLKIIHVAGTKGKGSTCAFLASILQEAGFKVGLYTSPHLHRVNERIRILNTENIRSKDNFSGSIGEEELACVLTDLRPFAAAIQNEGNILTFFEVLTVAALYYFARSQVDIVILETGLGGRLDATNAVDSSIAVITPVSLDHARILGSTLSQIASEKAGIIKNSNQKVVIAPQEKQAMDVILNRCREFGIQPILVCPDKYENLRIGLKGKHQMMNAALAVETLTVLKTMGFKISDEAVSEGLKHVRWPGRFELLQESPDVIVDCAHNGASAQALSRALKEVYHHRRLILVLGISQDKDIAAICYHLKDNAARIILTKAQHPRAHLFTQAECNDYFGDKPFEIIESLSQALKKALQIAHVQDVVVVTGSIFVVAEAIDCLVNKERGQG